MVLTRSQARGEQTSSPVASLGVNSPQRQKNPLQGEADVVTANNGVGGGHARAAFGEAFVDRSSGSRGD